MTPKVKKRLLSVFSKTFIVSFAVCAPFASLAPAADIPLNTPEASKERDQAEPSPTAPGRVGVARIQSAGQKIVEEDAIQGKAKGAASLPQPMPKGATKMKKVKSITDSSSDKNDMRQVRGASAMQDDDSLFPGSDSKGKASKGKSAGKEDSF